MLCGSFMADFSVKKTDVMSQLEKESDFGEEKFDYVQQVLRTICLKCKRNLNTLHF